MDSNRIINNKSIFFKNILYTPTNVSLYMHYHKHLAHDFIYKQNINLFKAPKTEKIVLNMTDKTIVKYTALRAEAGSYIPPYMIYMGLYHYRIFRDFTWNMIPLNYITDV